MPRAAVIIPARWGSTRLPGKPLARIAGRTLLERVVHLARRAVVDRPDSSVAVATDHPAVAAHAEALGCPVVLTGSDISSGSGRVLAAALMMNPVPAMVVNLQGDAPFVPPATVRSLLDALAAGAQVVTPVTALDWAALDGLREHKRTTPFSGTTCIVADDGRALWFSKQVIPAIRDEAAWRARHPVSPVLRHLGVYGYALPALRRFESLPVHPIEAAEGLEQLRLLVNGIRVDTVVATAGPIDMGGIDTPADLARAEALIASHGDPLA